MKKVTPVAVFVFCCLPIFLGAKMAHAEIICIHLFMTFVCVRELFRKSGYPYSLYKVLHLFFLFFMCIAPIVQLNNNVRMLDTRFTYSNYLLTSSTLLITLLLMKFVYIKAKKYYSKRYGFQKDEESKDSSKRISFKKIAMMILLSASVALFVLYLNRFNIETLIFRGAEAGARVAQSQIQMLIFDNFVKPIPLVLFLSAVILKINQSLVKVFLFMFLLIAVPPTGVARLFAAAIYIPVILTLFPFFRRGNNFVLLFCFGLLVVFPFLNLFRYYTSGPLYFDTDAIFSQFTELHFDAYSMMMRVLKDDIVTYGRQLLGAVFFWIPRAIWPNKPVGSGIFVAEETGLSFNNISMPFWGEGYINFGFIGIAVFAVVLAVVLAKIDSRFWNITVRCNQNLDAIKYYILIGLLMFILRGDMLSSTAYTSGIIVSFLFVKYWIIR